MLPVSLLALLLLELSGYAALAHFWLQAPWPQACLAAGGAMLGLRAGMVTITWVFAFAYRSPAPRLSLWQSLSMMLNEYLAFILTFVLVIPFERLWMPGDRLRPCQLPIVLVHGYGCSRGVWWKIRRDLEAAGHTVASVSLTPPYTSVGKLVPQLKTRIDEVCAACEAQQVILIAHSMGGLVCRSYLSRHGISQVNRLISIASPHQGSELARIGLGQNAREMEPGSLWLSDLAAEPVAIPFTSIRTPHDNYVMPQDNQRLSGAEDVELAGIGHLAVLYANTTSKVVIERCNNIR